MQVGVGVHSPLAQEIMSWNRRIDMGTVGGIYISPLNCLAAFESKYRYTGDCGISPGYGWPDIYQAIETCDHLIILYHIIQACFIVLKTVPVFVCIQVLWVLMRNRYILGLRPDSDGRSSGGQDHLPSPFLSPGAILCCL